MPSFRRLRSILIVALLSSLLASASVFGADFALIPASAPHGARVIITGTGLDDPSIAALFAAAGGTLPATIVSRMPTAIEVVVPPTATTGLLTVMSGSGTLATLSFTVVADPPFINVATRAAPDKAHDLLKQLSGVAVVPSGFLYAADTMHHQIVSIAPTGQVSVIAGTGKPGAADGAANQAQFKEPGAIAVDAVRGVIYIADTGNNVIRKVTFDGFVSTFAGSGRGESRDGSGSVAGFKTPSGMALDAAGNVYVADTGNDQVRKITPAGVVTTIGGGTHGGFADGTAAQSLFSQPRGVACSSSGAVFVADSGNNRIRKIENGAVTTIAGTGHGGFVDGSAGVAEFKNPSGIAVDDGGSVYIADTGNNAIRKIATGGVSTISGTGKGRYIDGAVAIAEFNTPAGIAIEGAIYVADSKNDALRVIYPAAAFAATTPNQGAPSGGTLIRVLGSGFVAGATQVTIGGTPVTDSAMTYVSSTELLITTPPHDVSGLVDVVVTTPAGSSTGKNAYTYGLAAPSIGSLSKTKGRTSGGETVTLTGANFVIGQTTVRLGGADATQVVVTSTTSLSFLTPTGSPGPTAITVTTPGGTATRAAAFQYMAAPIILSFTPTHGTPGTIVTITGQNFDPLPSGNAVAFAGTPAVISSAAATQLVVAVPTGAANGVITVTTAGGTATSATVFPTSSITLAITAPALSFAQDASVPFNALTRTSDGLGTDVTSQAVWSTSASAVATISAAGVATGRGAGTATITATYNGLTASATIHVAAAVVPILMPAPLDATVAQPLSDGIRFLYTGPSAVQTGVGPNAIDALRAATIRGSVRDHAANPAAAVTITVAGHPEFGQTTTRADGIFDLAINGGGPLTLHYSKAGFIGAERTIATNALEQKTIDDVILIGFDGRVNAIAVSAAVPQIARGTVMNDSSGSRQATMLFAPGTSASMTTPAGVVGLTALSIRATEYSVGPNGPKAMPASLPPQSTYTYCVELSVDEALAAGATALQFSKPVSFYVENFLGFPIGTQVPLGFYDPTKSAWIPSQDGRVIRIVAIESGVARVDTDGDGLADDTGLDATERQQLGSLYASGTSLWRLTMTHFTTWDANYSSAVTLDGTAPNGQATWFPAGACPTTIPNNSTIECQNQTLGEAVPVTGAPFELHYQSDRTPGRIASRTIDIPLSGATIPSTVKRIELEITVAGRTMHQTFSSAAGQQFRFVWDGLDVFGRPITGGAPVTVRTSYVYDAQYLFPARVPASFSLASGIPSGVPARLEVSATQQQQGTLGSWSAASERMGGWTISSHHFYDPASKTLYRGDGTRKTDTPARFGVTTGVLSTIAGNGTFDTHWTGADGLASAATIDRTEGMTVGPDGSVYLASEDFIHKITPDGVLRRIAGLQPNPIPTSPQELETTKNAATAHVFRPRGMSVGPDGSLYLAEPRNRVVRRIAPDGQITPFAGVPGNCNVCFTDNLPARVAQLDFPDDVAAASDGSVYIQDSADNARVRRVGPDGIITTVAGNGVHGYSGDGGPAIAASLGSMNGIALGPDGSLYIAEEFRVRRVGPDGIITTVAGNGTRGTSGDGGPATSASIQIGWGGARAFSVGADGSIYFADDARIRRVDPTGIITTVSGTTNTLSLGTSFHDGAFGTASDLTHIDAMTAAPDGRPFFSEFDSWIVRTLRPTLPVFTPNSSEITVADGSLVYIFTPRGQHLRTIDAETGAVLYSFSYTNGVLATITDVVGNVTTIERNGADDATAVIASGGQRTEITGAPYATAITTAPGETTQFTYSPDGLMTGKTDARNNSSVFSWNELGLLNRDAGPDGGSIDANRTEIADGHVAVLTTAGGKTTRYTTTATGNGDNVSTIIDPAGLTITSVRHQDASTVTTFPDGSIMTSKEAADPLWSTQSPFTSSVTLRLPSGRTSFMTMTRDATTSQAGNPQTIATRTDSMTVNGRTFRRVFDRASLTDTLTTPANRIVTNRRDASGRPVEWLLPALVSFGISYDANGRVQSIHQGSRQQTFAYNTRNDVTSTTDSLNRTTRFEYDAADRMTKQILPDLREIRFSYDSNGNVTSVTPPSRPAHAFTFTPVNLIGGYTPPTVPGGGATTYRYNSDRQLTLITRPDGDTITPLYDAAGRISALQTAAATLAYEYDSAGRLASISNSAGSSLGYSYDGRLITQQQWNGPVSGTISYSYDADLRLASENGVSFAYDDDGLLTRAGALTLSRAADTGFLTGTRIGMLSDAYTYNTFGETSEYSLMENGAVVYDEQYARDDAGRITSRTDIFNGATTTTTTTGYGYDTAGHLTSVTRDGTQTTAYSYNENGGRTAKIMPGPRIQRRTTIRIGC
jgi:YD repeat-containing protein